MTSPAMPTEIATPFRFTSDDARRAAILFAGFVLLHLVSWPVEYSFGYWVFGDRGNFLNLAYLQDAGLRIGVDTYYLYGLLPVLVQDGLFAVFGRGPWPIIGCHVVYLALMAGGFAVLVRNATHPLRWTLLLFAMSPIIIWVNQNVQYLFVHVSMIWALALVLERRLPLALVVSAIGCWSVPSLPLVLTAGLLLLIAIDWWRSESRSLAALLRAVVPAAIAYLAIGAALTLRYGFESVLATALPFQGASFYKSVDYGLFTSLKIFLYPGRTEARPEWSPLRYYLFDRATWWLLSSALLTVFSAAALKDVLVKRRPSARSQFILLAGGLHIVFVLVAYGIPSQHVFYDFLLVAGVVVALAGITQPTLQRGLIGIWALVAVMSLGNQAGNTRWLWKSTQPSAESRGFYAFPEVVKDFGEIVALSKQTKLLLLTYATGVHHYYPTVHTPQSWIINYGQLLPADKTRLLASIADAERVVLDMTRITTFFERDPDVVKALSAMCLVSRGNHFAIWRHTPPDPATGQCESWVKPLPEDIRLRGEFAL